MGKIPASNLSDDLIQCLPCFMHKLRLRADITVVPELNIVT